MPDAMEIIYQAALTIGTSGAVSNLHQRYNLFSPFVVVTNINVFFFLIFYELVLGR